MKASELRIGNYVDPYHNWNGPVQITSISENKIIHTPSSNGAVNDVHIKPIPLTEEWLVKFGFEKKFLPGICVFSFSKDRFSISTIERVCKEGELILEEIQCGIFHGDPLTGYNQLRGIKYVHQIQNLYFALTGTELTITK